MEVAFEDRFGAKISFSPAASYPARAAPRPGPTRDIRRATLTMKSAEERGVDIWTRESLRLSGSYTDSPLMSLIRCIGWTRWS
jgi:hypothetical protein